MQNIHVKRYSNPEGAHHLGWIEPEDRAWLLFIDTEGRPVLMLRKDVEQVPGATEATYVNACAVVDAEGVEVKQITLHQLGLKVLGFNLKGQFVEEALASPPDLMIKAKEALDVALEEPGTRWGEPYRGRVVSDEPDAEPEGTSCT